MDLYKHGFVVKIQENLETVSANMQPDILKALISYKNEELNLISNSNPIVLTNQFLTFEIQERSLNGTHLKNCLDCNNLLTFKVGIYEREEYIYYDEKISHDYIYVSKKNSFVFY